MLQGPDKESTYAVAAGVVRVRMVAYLAAGAGGDHAPAAGEVGLGDMQAAAPATAALLPVVALPDDPVPVAARLVAVGGRRVHVAGADGLLLAHASCRSISCVDSNALARHTHTPPAQKQNKSAVGSIGYAILLAAPKQRPRSRCIYKFLVPPIGVGAWVAATRSLGAVTRLGGAWNEGAGVAWVCRSFVGRHDTMRSVAMTPATGCIGSR